MQVDRAVVPSAWPEDPRTPGGRARSVIIHSEPPLRREPRRRTVVEVALEDGQELRDEFTCPITRQLMRVPVIAADGHTYDRSAIERWLLHHDISPRTGDLLDHKLLVPNHNLKRLVDDLVAEGGEGLYSAARPPTPSRRSPPSFSPRSDDDDDDDEAARRLGASSREEGSKPRTRSRAVSDDDDDDVEAHRVATPSRFPEDGASSSENNDNNGVPPPREKRTAPRRQRAQRCASLVTEPVLLLQCLGPPESEWNGRTFEVTRAGAVGGRRRTATGLSSSSSFRRDDGRSSPVLPNGGGPAQQQHNNHVLRNRAPDVMPFSDSTVSRRHFEIWRDESDETFRLRDLGSASGTFRRLRPGAKFRLDGACAFMIGKHQLRTAAEKTPDGALLVECYAPDGSPLQGRAFRVDRKAGATLGRRVANDVSFSQDIDGEPVGIDSSISSEHARITFSPSSATDITTSPSPSPSPSPRGGGGGRSPGSASNDDDDDDARDRDRDRDRARRCGSGGSCPTDGHFELADGNADGRPSTNGTWIRLGAPPPPPQTSSFDAAPATTSPPGGLHQSPAEVTLTTGDELLVGTIRFHVTVTHTIVEREGTSPESSFSAPAAGSGASSGHGSSSRASSPDRCWD